MSRNVAAWRLATSTCPHCVSLEDEAKDACLSCGGTGDLLGWMLLRAYEEGERAMLRELREVQAVRKLAVARVAELRPTARQLRSRMGV